MINLSRLISINLTEAMLVRQVNRTPVDRVHMVMNKTGIFRQHAQQYSQFTKLNQHGPKNYAHKSFSTPLSSFSSCRSYSTSHHANKALWKAVKSNVPKDISYSLEMGANIDAPDRLTTSEKIDNISDIIFLDMCALCLGPLAPIAWVVIHRSYPKIDMTVLMHAAAENNNTSVKLLIDKGANLNIQDKNGMTALMHAAQLGCLESIKLFLNQHNALDAAQVESAMKIAITEGHIEIAALLNRHL